MRPALPRPLTLLAFAVLTALLFVQFMFNPLGTTPEKMFETRQIYGQARVLGALIADRHGLDKDGANMGFVTVSAERPADAGGLWPAWQTYEVFDDYPGNDAVEFAPYTRQFGLHAITYSALGRLFGLTRLEQLQAIAALLSALSIAALTLLYRRIFDPWFAGLFVAALAFGPMFMAMARNLYWSPILLFLPAVFGALAWLEQRPARRWLWIGAAGLAMVLKSASNYEYITTVTVLAMAPFLAAPFFSDAHCNRPQIGWAMAVWGACVLGFAVALMAHAGARGDTVLEGLRSIYAEDIARRTFGNAGDFSGEAAESQDASILDTLKIYFYEGYPDKRSMLLPGKVFLALIGLSLIGLAHKGMTRHPAAGRDFWLFVTFLAVPLSWLIAAKGHAYTQTHINFVLWYIGFIPALIYVASSAVVAPLRSSLRRIRSEGRVVERP